MDIKQVVQDLNRVFQGEGIPITLAEGAYDCGFIENIPKSEIIRPTKKEQKEKQEAVGVELPQPTRSRRDNPRSENSNNQTHYVISSAEYFDFLMRAETGGQFKYRYPFQLYAENLRLLLNYVPNDYYPDEMKDYLTERFIDGKGVYETCISAVTASQNRVMLASKEGMEDTEANRFLCECRYAQFEQDYLIILKHRKKFGYSMFFLPAPIVEAYDLPYADLKYSLIGELSKTYVDLSTSVEVVGAKNLLVFGAPGTGKSHWVKSQYEDRTETMRVTFHEEYSYQDFIGGLKPVTDDEGAVKYEFKAGPFTRILAGALGNRHKSYTLIIEEMNRANAAAVFGDVFQLLDRNAYGVSKYTIEQQDMARYIAEELGGAVRSEISLPSNLNIVATMNSADQGVFILDTAFKRRWQFKYIPIEFDEWHAEKKIDYVHIGGTTYEISVRDFIEVLNDYLSTIESLEINEDRLIGPYFIDQNQWDHWFEGDVFQKLLNYLWDDIARISRSEVFDEKYKQFSKLCQDFKRLDIVFTGVLHAELLDKCHIKGDTV